MVLSSQAPQIRILRLVDGQHNDGILYRLQKQWVLHFMLGSTLASRKVTIYTNVPQDGKAYDRSKYRKLDWNTSSELNGDRLDDFASLTLKTAGSFQYYFEYDGKKSGSGYFIVDPTLTIGSDDKVLPLDAVCMQTVLPKLLGKFSSWKDRLQVGKESGYNVFHFTPVQELGVSKSAYSIADQLLLNPNFSEENAKPVTMKEMKSFVEDLRKTWNILSVTDVVWNHTAKNSTWLQVHPECAYNLFNSPYMRPSYLLDRAVFHLSLDIVKGKYDKKFEKRKIRNLEDVETIKKILETDIIPPLKLHEFFQVNVEEEIAKFQRALSSTTSLPKTTESLSILQDPEYIRFGCTVDMEIAVRQFGNRESPNVDESVQAFKDTIIWLNKVKEEETAQDLEAAVSNILSTVTYERLASHGPKHEEITADCPLVTTYFNHPFPHTSPEDEETQIMGNVSKGKLIMAYNGWVMGADALKNFAESPGKVYFRRELICWGDSVKLRYGSKPSDCPALWDRMMKYTEMTAQVFHGIRIDNCHSTPIHVAEYMLDAARRIQPDIYVFAELFTGSENVDNIFVNRLGLTSLIREALNAWDSHELGRLVYLYGGEPIASFVQPFSQDLKPSRAHALFYDITHDNESMITKRSIHDLIPSSALVTMSSCAIGSNRGHDEMTPHHIHVVNEARLYRKWVDGIKAPTAECVGNFTALIKVKNILNHLHQTLALNGFDQVFVDQRTPDVVVVTRHNPRNHLGYLLIAYTSFKDLLKSEISPLKVEGVVTRIAVEAKPKLGEKSTADFLQDFAKDKQFINGIDDYKVYVQTDMPVDKSTCCKITCENDGKNLITFTNFIPGTVLVLSVKMLPSADNAILQTRNLIQSLSNDAALEFNDIVKNLDLRALNRVLFHCNEEELSDGLGIGVYDFPNFGKLCYCGIAAVAVQMAKIRRNNDLGHPICTNLREGNWLLEYLSSRLIKHQETQQLGLWFEKVFRVLGQVPRFLVPMYFEIILSLTCEKLFKSCWNQMSDFIKNGSMFVKRLSLGTVALCGHIKGANLPQLHPDIKDLLYSSDDPELQICLSMAAGLPHFSSGVMRCWGRDTFIAMHGLQMVTGQYVDARNLILAFAGCVRHGLIPNLLGEGKISRYNCRDAVWFWLQCIQELCLLNGYGLLQMPVARIFPKDSSPPCRIGTKTQALYDVIQEVLQRHVDGISFRERNAGPQIDMNMSDLGFNVTAGINLETGFVFGGSQHNCGTWMDKMGESEKAGTRGVPATPRDGSAIELVGLCKSTVSWLQEANAKGRYPYDGVTPKGGTKLTWVEWNNKISDNFEKYFYVSDEDKSDLVHKRYIYKDTCGSSMPWCDYQLRPNFPIAMVYAPELFEPTRAWKALQIAQDKLLGPLGMKTLDPDDLKYRGDYDNSNDSDDPTVAKGFNYHQGPEWLWPVGYFLRAKLYFAGILGPEVLKETINFIHSYIVKHQLHIEDSAWCGLPELTNSEGSFCKDSCLIQAWSHATLLDLLNDMSKLS